MAIETENHACKRDLEKTLSTEKLKRYDNAKGGDLSRGTYGKEKKKGGEMRDSFKLSEECSDFMELFSLKEFDCDGYISLEKIVVDHLAPAFISGGAD